MPDPASAAALLRACSDGDESALAPPVRLIDAELRRLVDLWLPREMDGSAL